MKTIFILALVCFSVNINAQIVSDWKLFPSKDSTKTTIQKDSIVNQTAADTIYEITPSDKPGTIKINKDDRIDAVSTELATPNDGVSVKIRGYRLQLIASNKKATVDEERIKFMAINPEVSTYTDYVQPNYKLKVGDFKTKLEAQKLQHDIRLTFPSALVVSDLIELPKIKK